MQQQNVNQYEQMMMLANQDEPLPEQTESDQQKTNDQLILAYQ
jgi:hypothetical protein